MEATSAVRFRMLALGKCNAITNRLCGETGLTFAGAVQGAFGVSQKQMVRARKPRSRERGLGFGLER
jgi:hypothetical protein